MLKFYIKTLINKIKLYNLYISSINNRIFIIIFSNISLLLLVKIYADKYIESKI